MAKISKIHTLYKTIDGETKEMRVNDSSLEYGLSLGWKNPETKTDKKPKKPKKDKIVEAVKIDDQSDQSDQAKD